MNQRLGLSLVFIGLLTLTGCASQDNSLRSQVNALTERGAAQDREIAHLKEEAGKAKDVGITTAEDAWAWLKSHSQAAWNSDTSVHARDRFQKCWDDLSHK